MSSVKLFLFFTVMMVVFTGCQEDLLYQDAAKPTTEAPFQKSDFSQEPLRESIRNDIQMTLSLAMTEHAIRYGLLGKAAEMKTGDTEVLLSDFLAAKSENGTTYGELIAKFSQDDKFLQTLSQLIEERPSLLIACRGNIGKWADEHFVPSVYVKEDNFSEKADFVTGHNSGKEQEIDLLDWEHTAFVAIHLSERHDSEGKPLYIAGNLPVLNPHNNNGVLEPSDGTNTGSEADPLVPSEEPTFCPAEAILNSFNVTEHNGAILIDYSIGGYPLSIGDWVRITIQRLGVNGDVQNFLRSGSDPSAFIDSSLPIGHNLTFTYTISIDIIYTDANTGELVQCSVANTPQTMSATISTEEARVNTFTGTNVSSHQIRYNWIDPVGGTATEYRLQQYDLNTGTYQLVTQQPASANNSFTYNYPPEFRNEKVHMLIQYRSNNEALWRGDFYDQTYGSFRNSNEALKYYGLWLPNPLDYEVSSTGESLVHGSPEVRFLALKAVSESEDDLPETVQHTIIYTRNCCYSPWEGGSTVDLLFWVRNLISCRDAGNGEFYVPLNSFGVKGFTILPGWQNDLPGSNVRLYTRETDIPELVNFDESITEEEDVAVKIGVKLPKILGGVEVGLDAGSKTTRTRTFKYPTTDIFLNNFELSYFEQHLRRSGNEMFGLFTEDEEAVSCEVLSRAFE